jgi:hypothetical protein
LSDASKARDNVVLPAPDGEDITKSKPRRGMRTFCMAYSIF